MMRIKQAQAIGQQLAIPESNASNYYFNCKLVTLGKPVFDPNSAAGRVRIEEFMELRQKMIQAGGTKLTLAKWLFYLRFIVAFLSLLSSGLRTALRYAHALTLTREDYYIMILIILVPNFLVNYAWNKISKQALQLVQAVVTQENANTFRDRKVVWKINPNLLYMQLTILQDANYRPPENVRNAVHAYPAEFQSLPNSQSPPPQNGVGPGHYNLLQDSQIGQPQPNPNIPQSNMNRPQPIPNMVPSQQVRGGARGPYSLYTQEPLVAHGPEV